MAKDQMSQEDFAVVKLAAAERYRERNIRPETASYLFDRTLRKEAQVPAPQAGPTKARAFFEANRGRSPLQAAVNVDGAKPDAKATLGRAAAAAAAKAIKGVGEAYKKVNPGNTLGKAMPKPKEASAPDMGKITKLASALKRTIPAKKKA